MSVIYRVLIVGLLSISASAVAESLFDFKVSTPEGSWVVREVTTTDHKGRQKVTIIKQKNLGSERRQGQDYYWLETEIDVYKLKKGKRKRDGEHMVMKVLVPKKIMSSDPANVVNNLQGFGQEIIMQTGDNRPMRLSGGGMLAGATLKAMGVEVKYQFTAKGTETIETAAGQFKTRKVAGTGHTSSKILFKKIEIESQSMLWISDKVPFGIVKSDNTDLINGKEQRSQTVLMKYANSGALSAIKGEVLQMPF